MESGGNSQNGDGRGLVRGMSGTLHIWHLAYLAQLFACGCGGGQDMDLPSWVHHSVITQVPCHQKTATFPKNALYCYVGQTATCLSHLTALKGNQAISCSVQYVYKGYLC